MSFSDAFIHRGFNAIEILASGQTHGRGVSRALLAGCPMNFRAHRAAMALFVLLKGLQRVTSDASHVGQCKLKSHNILYTARLGGFQVRLCFFY
jgi:hypothetical protein